MTQLALEALLKGEGAAAAGDVATARDCFDRALRLSPDDPVVTLALAELNLTHRRIESADMYARVARQHDLREAWLGLATACHLQGLGDQAAEALRCALGRHAFATTGFAPLADAIAQALDAPGWCVLDSTGTLTVRLSGTLSRHAKPKAFIDGLPVALQAQAGGRAFTAQLPGGSEPGGVIVVRMRGREILGSPIAAGTIMRVEGFADTSDGDLHGWAWQPNNPDRDPVLSIVPMGGGTGIAVTADDLAADIRHPQPLARPRGFHVDAARLRQFDGPVRVLGEDGRDLTGSPLDPSAERRSAAAASRSVAQIFPVSPLAPAVPEFIPLVSVPAHVIGSQRRGGDRRRPVDVVVPVYGGLDLALSCLDAVLADLPRWARVLVADDASPDPRVAQALNRLAGLRQVTLLTQPVNRGFPCTANAGMRHDPSRDVVLLNSDTLVPPGWLARLRDAAYSAPGIGTATPLSNDATIASYPSVNDTNPVPTGDETIRIDALAQRANESLVVDIPTAVGFCMYIKRDCLEDTGLFREDVFAQGYGEENDFCIRARHLGWRHVAVPGVFVAHVGGQSFSSTRSHLIERNLRILNRLHPGYDTLIRDFRDADPLAEHRRRLDMACWESFRNGAESVLLVTHSRGGGVQRRVAERAGALRREGLRPIVIWPVASRAGEGRDCVLGNGPEGGTPNLRFAVPSELDLLAGFLRADLPVRAEVHHLVGHDHALLELFKRLGIPYDIAIHDYSWFCPRISLIGPDSRYCGEPDIPGCEACVTDAGTKNEEDTEPRALRDRSAAEMSDASCVVVPSHDAAARMRRHFPHVLTKIMPWEEDGRFPPQEPPRPPSDDVRRICLVGAIGIEKGYEVLLACARDVAKRKLKLAFRLVGHSCDDDRLLATGCVHISGRYGEHEAVALIRSQQAQLGWLPSIWPETWCYTLSLAWQAGLDVAAFDIGAQAERIRSTGRGWLYPLGVPPPVLNDHLLKLRPRRATP